MTGIRAIWAGHLLRASHDSSFLERLFMIFQIFLPQNPMIGV